MATATLSNTPTVIDNAESTTNWGGDSFSLEPDIKVQGTYSVACTQTNNGTNDVYVTGSWNFSTDVHLRLWMNSSIVAPYGDTEANGGVQIFLYDGTNTAYYTVGGSDTYGGGWKQWVVYTGNTPDSGSVNKSSITRIGIRINTTSKPRNVTNGWYDAWTYGDGYTITGGTSGDPIDWSHIASVDSTNAYGIVTEKDGVYFLSGDIKIGSGSTTTYFEPSSQICVYRDLPVSSSLYQILFQGTGCHADISGGTIAAAGTQRFVFDANDSNLNSFTLDGAQLTRAGLSYFKAGQTIQNCTFNDCLQIDPSTSTFTKNSIVNSTDTGGALLFPSDDSNLSGVDFINNDYGVEYDSNSDTTTPTFRSLTFDDVSGKYDVNNTSGSSVTIYKNGTANPNSYTGSTVTFSGSVTVTITVKDEAGDPIHNVQTAVYKTSDRTEIMNEDTNSSGIATETYTGTTPVEVEVRCRKASAGSTKYINYSSLQTITTSGLSLSVTLREDTNNNATT